MNKIFAGLIMLLVKINLNLVGIPITIFPDFVAYIFIYFGLSELSMVTLMFRKSLRQHQYEFLDTSQPTCFNSQPQPIM